MSEQFKNTNVTVTSVSKNEDGTENRSEKAPLFRGGHIALTSCNEQLCNYLCESAVDKLDKSKNGLYEMTSNSLLMSVRLDTELEFLRPLSEKFDSNSTYAYPVTKKDVLNFIEKTHKDRISLTDSGYNCLSYLLYQFTVNATRIVGLLIKELECRSVTKETVLCSVKIMTSSQLLTGRFEKGVEACNIGEKEDGAEGAEDKQAEEPAEVEATGQENNEAEPVVAEAEPVEKTEPVKEETKKETKPKSQPKAKNGK